MYCDYGDGYVEDVTATSKWTIENFCLSCNEYGDCYTSPNFFANRLRWGLRLFPISDKDENYTAISLAMFTNAEVTVTYDLSVINDDNQRFRTIGEKRAFFRHKSVWTCTRFVRHEELTSRKNRLLVNGTLTILCEIRVDFHTYPDSKSDEVELPVTKRVKVPDNFFDFEQFLLSQKFCDVTFIVGDKKLSAHKVLLASKSVVFAGMFENQEGGRGDVVEITDVDYNVFVEVLRFMYTRSTKDLKDVAKRLFVAANKFGLADLRNLCADALVKELNKSNAIEYLGLADRYGLQTLRSKALDFVATNVDGLKNSAK